MPIAASSSASDENMASSVVRSRVEPVASALIVSSALTSGSAWFLLACQIACWIERASSIGSPAPRASKLTPTIGLWA
jgi:hypothetical protein